MTSATGEEVLSANLFSTDGLHWFLENMVTNFTGFAPLGLGIGTNTSFGGVNKADCHMDGIILNPTLYLDDELIIKDGEFQV